MVIITKMKDLRYKLIIWAAKAMFLIFIVPALLVIRPLIHVKFAMVQGGRIGHLATEIGSFVQKNNSHDKVKRSKIVIISTLPANRALMDIFKRHITIFDNDKLFLLATFCAPLMRYFDAYVLAPCEHSNLKYRCFNKWAPPLVLTEDEKTIGYEELADVGLTKNDWFVAFHARSNNYFEKNFPGYNFHYHDYRNCSDLNYLEAAEYVASIGGLVFRMGTAMDDALPTERSIKIIDFATHHYTPFLDVFLCSQSRFMLANSSGLYAIATIAGVPVAAANMAPLISFPVTKKDLFIPKMIYCNKENRVISFEEIIRRNIHNSYSKDIYDSKNVSLIENSSEDILDLCKEMLDLLNGVPIPTEGIEMQREFKRRFLIPYVDGAEEGGNISYKFLQKHPELMK